MSGKVNNNQSNHFRSQAASLAKKAAQWPPLVWLALGIILGVFWLGGTCTEVSTSIAWMTRQPVQYVGFSPLWQFVDFFHGTMSPNMLMPFIYAWGVQGAGMVGSFGVELPREPKWRYWVAIGLCVVLIVSNSGGDWESSKEYGFWGQCGFTTVLLFITFGMGLFSIMAFRHAFSRMKQPPQPQQQVV